MAGIDVTAKEYVRRELATLSKSWDSKLSMRWSLSKNSLPSCRITPESI